MNPLCSCSLQPDCEVGGLESDRKILCSFFNEQRNEDDAISQKTDSKNVFFLI